MIRALLLDLDDTLLINDWQVFFPPYLERLCAHVQGLVPERRFIHALNAGWDAMFRSKGDAGTLDQVFMETFLPLAQVKAETIVPALIAFYRNGFDELSAFTQPDPAARPLVKLAREQGLKLAIATQPVFPLEAVEARLRWADVPAETVDYDYIATYDTQKACKPAAIFFADIIGRLGVSPTEALMVGDSANSDMAARDLGLKTFYVERGRDRGADHVDVDARGDLADLVDLLRTGAIHEL